MLGFDGKLSHTRQAVIMGRMDTGRKQGDLGMMTVTKCNIRI